jgi:hypothetical protein
VHVPTAGKSVKWTWQFWRVGGKGEGGGEGGEGGGKRANISGLLNFATASPRTFSEIHSSIKFQSNNTSEFIYLNIVKYRYF